MDSFGCKSGQQRPRAFDESQYDQVLAFYNEPRWLKVRLGLDRIRLLLELLGNPQNEFKTVHVAGTNGKGSTCAFLDSILRASGLKCGLFTSPYIERFEERIQVDGENISVADLIDVTARVRDCASIVEERIGEHPTEFELMCAAAFTHFAKEGCDAVVCEVGLGGRLDATNVVDPALCMITRIGLDHTDTLGETIEQIASEKAGIIKQGAPVVSWPQEGSAMAVIKDACAKAESPLYVADFSTLAFGDVSPASNCRSFSYEGADYETAMIADYQIRNAALAICAARVLSAGPFPEIDEDAIRKGMRDARWPGRFEVLGDAPLFVLDGAHNPQGAESLRETLESLGLPGGLTLICGMLADKDCEQALEAVLPLARNVFTYAPNNPRALSSNGLADIARSIARDTGLRIDIRSMGTPEEAVAAALEKENPEGAIISFGTLYALSDVRFAYLALKPLSA